MDPMVDACPVIKPVVDPVVWVVGPVVRIVEPVVWVVGLVVWVAVLIRLHSFNVIVVFT